MNIDLANLYTFGKSKHRVNCKTAALSFRDNPHYCDTMDLLPGSICISEIIAAKDKGEDILVFGQAMLSN